MRCLWQHRLHRAGQWNPIKFHLQMRMVIKSVQLTPESMSSSLYCSAMSAAVSRAWRVSCTAFSLLDGLFGHPRNKCLLLKWVPYDIAGEAWHFPSMAMMSLRSPDARTCWQRGRSIRGAYHDQAVCKEAVHRNSQQKWRQELPECIPRYRWLAFTMCAARTLGQGASEQSLEWHFPNMRYNTAFAKNDA